MVEHRMNGDDDIRLDGSDQAQQTIMNERGGDSFYGRDPLRLIAQVKKAPIELGIIADSWSIELDGFTQWKTAVVFKYVDDFDAVGIWLLRLQPLRPSSKTRPGLLLLALRDQLDGVMDCVGCAAMPSPGVSDEEQYSSLRHTGSLPFAGMNCCKYKNRDK